MKPGEKTVRSDTQNPPVSIAHAEITIGNLRIVQQDDIFIKIMVGEPHISRIISVIGIAGVGIFLTMFEKIRKC